MIHGEKDAYIGPEIARTLFAEAQRARRSSGSSPRPSTTAAARSSPRPTPSGSLDFLGRYAPRRPVAERRTSPTPAAEPRSPRAVAVGAGSGDVDGRDRRPSADRPMAAAAVATGPTPSTRSLERIDARCSTSSSKLVGLPLVRPVAAAGPGVPRPDRPGRRGPARPAPARGSPATPTASSAATTTSREIRTPADFRRRVPIRGYDRHEPYIDRVRQGDTRRPVRRRGPRS